MYDVLIKKGKTASDEPIEIGILNHKIVAVADQLSGEAKEVITLADHQRLSAGWIDSHVHCYEKMSLYYDFPDEIGIKKGVTTVIDAGSTGENNITAFYQIAKKCQTNVLALMNISRDGIVAQDELADLKKINQEKNRTRIQALPDFIVGIKARMSRTVVGNNDVKPLILAKELQHQLGGIPLMVHIGSAPPELSAILSLLEAGDIVTHCYNGKSNGILDDHEQIKPFVWEAYRKGIIFDIGHGTDSFNFDVAQQATSAGMICHSISTDIHHRNRQNGPVYDLATTLEKGLAIGLTLSQVIDMVTKNPADLFNLKQKGRIEVGMDADLTIFNVINQTKKLTDSNGNQVTINQQIVPNMVLVGGKSFPIE